MRAAARANSITTGDSWTDKYAKEKVPSTKRYVCMEVKASLYDAYELALSCDRQLAQYNTKFHVMHAKRGVCYLRTECVIA